MEDEEIAIYRSRVGPNKRTVKFVVQQLVEMSKWQRDDKENVKGQMFTHTSFCDITTVWRYRYA